MYLGLSIEKSILSSNDGNYETIDDFLNDFVIQENEINEEIKGYELNNISIPYIDLEIKRLNEIAISQMTEPNSKQKPGL